MFGCLITLFWLTLLQVNWLVATPTQLNSTVCDDQSGKVFQVRTADGVRRGCQATFCDDEVFGPFAKRYCPASCDTCSSLSNQTAAQVCQDDNVSISMLMTPPIPSCAAGASICSTSLLMSSICPKTCNTCDTAQQNAGSCYFGCKGDPFLCYLLGFLYPTMGFRTGPEPPQIATCTATCVSSAGRWGGLLSEWSHCLNYTRPIPDDCSLLEGGFVLWNTKDTICTQCSTKNCNDPSIRPADAARQKLPPVFLDQSQGNPLMFSTSLIVTPTSNGTISQNTLDQSTLADESTRVSGKIEVIFVSTNTRGSVCADQGDLSLATAIVACKELNLGSLRRTFSSPRKPGRSAISFLNCSGSEERLEQCTVSFSNPNGICFSDAAIDCAYPLFTAGPTLSVFRQSNSSLIEPNPLQKTTNTSGVLKFAVNDVNFDGLNDIIITSFTRGIVGWYRNIGLGNFGDLQVNVNNTFVLLMQTV